MPELPEVETIKCDLEKSINGLTIKSVEVLDGRILKSQPAIKFVRALSGQTIAGIARRSKALIISLKNGSYLVVHVGMTGQLIYGQKEILKETRVRFRLSNGEALNYNDQRLFGRLIVTNDLKEIPYLNSAGPEPLNAEFTVEWLRGSLRERSSPIKSLLMNQQFVAGIGNIYASEILFQAAINPQRQAARLKSNEVQALHKATIEVLSEAIELRGSSMRNYRDTSSKKGKFMSRIKVYAREGESCVICSKPIQRLVQSGRSTFFCKHCQK